MAGFNNLALTASGVKALLDAQAGKTLILTKIGMGSGTVANSTGLKNLVRTEMMLPISEYTVNEEAGFITVTAKMTNESVTNGFYWKETGLFFLDSEGKDVLFAYTCVGSDQYDYIPSFTEQRYVKHIRIANIVADTQNIVIQENAGLQYVDVMTFEEYKKHTHPYAGAEKAGGPANSAIKLETARTFNGLSFDGTANRSNYGTCSTGESVSAKTVACGGFNLTTGAEITVKFNSGNTASNMTLNVDGTGAKNVYYHGKALSAEFASGSVYTFRYTGSRWELVGDINTDTTYDDNDFLTAKNPKGSGSLSIGRAADTTVGASSGTVGSGNEASGNYSMSMGYGNKVTNQCADAFGYNNTASNDFAFACNASNVASGYESFACNSRNTASGNCSFAAGNYNEALVHQATFGHYNDTSKATENAVAGTSDGTAFVIGNGTSSSRSNAFRVTGKGEVIGKSAYQATGADLAELREWTDGNPNGEDRRGYFVTMEGLSIRIARPGDYICGIISANPCLIGNADEDWVGRYVFDEFGAFIYETVEEIDEETGEVIAYERYKMNAEYDPTREYVRRQDRPEWDFVGLTGVIAVRDDGSCEINGFCKCGSGGVATKSDRGYRVVGRVSENIIKVLFFLTGEIF